MGVDERNHLFAPGLSLGWWVARIPFLPCHGFHFFPHSFKGFLENGRYRGGSVNFPPSASCLTPLT